MNTFGTSFFSLVLFGNNNDNNKKQNNKQKTDNMDNMIKWMKKKSK